MNTDELLSLRYSMMHIGFQMVLLLLSKTANMDMSTKAGILSFLLNSILHMTFPVDWLWSSKAINGVVLTKVEIL